MLGAMKFLVLCGWWLFPLALAAEEPLNLTVAKQAVIAYHDDGRYAQDLSTVADTAKAWLRERAARRAEGERLAVVFDVDETVLSNYPHMVRRDFGYQPAQWVEWVAEAVAPPLAPVKAVYDLARELDLAVIFLTGRHDPEEKAGTLANLQAAGMGDYERIIFQTDGEAGTAAERKTARRAALTAEGFTLIASIGDQESDLAGGFVERTFKLPNPFYAVD